MSKLIRQLLKEDDPLFTIQLTRLEKSAGSPGIDARLTAELISMSRAKIGSLGLDPSDTTGAELYSALKQKSIDGDEQIHAYLGHPASADEASKKAEKLLNGTIGKCETWVIKPVVLRRILKKNPPKKVMKAFHFQSVDSIIKRMDVAEILLAARILELKTWQTKQHKAYESLESKDFEKNTVQLVALGDTRWLGLWADCEKRTGARVIGLKECGVVGFHIDASPGSYILTIPLALHAANELILHGSFMKLHLVHPSIGNALIHAFNDGEMIHTSISGVAVHWRSMQRYYGRQSSAQASFAHLDQSDLGWVDVEVKLSLLIPELAFWVGTDIVGVSYGDGRIISLNIHDVAKSVKTGLGYQFMANYYLARSLKSELLARYIEVPSARAVALKQFDVGSITSESW